MPVLLVRRSIYATLDGLSFSAFCKLHSLLAYFHLSFVIIEVLVWGSIYSSLAIFFQS